MKRLPKIFKPQLATLFDKVPEGDKWIHETKFDGYRILCFIEPGSIQLISRNGKSWGSKFPEIVKQLKTFPQKNTILDGELVVLNKNGLSKFQLLQNALDGTSEAEITYYVFDLPYLKMENLCTLSLFARKKKLKSSFQAWKMTSHPNVILTEYIKGMGVKIYREACRQGLEGIISKQIDSRYEQKRTRTWIKSKCVQQQEFVIGGFTKPKQSRKYFGALLLGYYDRKHNLIYCGKVGTGFSELTLKKLFQKMKPLIIQTPAFKSNNKIEKINQITWIKPKLAAQINFSEWTEEGRLRHPSFISLRQDKNSDEIRKQG